MADRYTSDAPIVDLISDVTDYNLATILLLY